MIVDSSVILNWILKGGKFEKECLRLRKAFENGSVRLRVPEFVIYDVCLKLAEGDIPTDKASKLVHLAYEYMSYFAVKLKGDMLAEAVRICRKYGVDFNVASCVVLSERMGDIYVTADDEVYKVLSEAGVKISHVRDLF